MAAPRVVGIVGPKGGVGKSTITANLAVALTRAGASVTAMDLDLGSANLHVIFGLKNVEHTLDDFLMNKVAGLESVLLETDVPGLTLIAGGNVPGIASLPYQKKVKLVRHLARLKSDFLILDLSPGASHNMADFALIAWRCLLVTTPDVPSLMSLYSFIKTAVYRRLSLFFRQAGSEPLGQLLDKAKDADAHADLKTMEDFYGQAAVIDPALAQKARQILAKLDFMIAVNRVRSAADLKAGQAIRNLMGNFLSLDGGKIYSVREDAAVSRAAARLKPALLDAPSCPFATDIETIVRALQDAAGRSCLREVQT